MSRTLLILWLAGFFLMVSCRNNDDTLSPDPDPQDQQDGDDDPDLDPEEEEEEDEPGDEDETEEEEPGEEESEDEESVENCLFSSLSRSGAGQSLRYEYEWEGDHLVMIRTLSDESIEEVQFAYQGNELINIDITENKTDGAFLAYELSSSIRVQNGRLTKLTVTGRVLFEAEEEPYHFKEEIRLSYQHDQVATLDFYSAEQSGEHPPEQVDLTLFSKKEFQWQNGNIKQITTEFYDQEASTARTQARSHYAWVSKHWVKPYRKKGNSRSMGSIGSSTVDCSYDSKRNPLRGLPSGTAAFLLIFNDFYHLPLENNPLEIKDQYSFTFEGQNSSGTSTQKFDYQYATLDLPLSAQVKESDSDFGDQNYQINYDYECED